MNRMQNFKNGLIKDNPVFGLYLGLCSTLAITTSINNAIGMGVAVIFVLILSNMIISAMRKLVPDEIRIPVYIVIIATLVKIIQMLIQAYAPALDSSLGVFIPLIVVNCIILGRAEAFASKNECFRFRIRWCRYGSWIYYLRYYPCPLSVNFCLQVFYR